MGNPEFTVLGGNGDAIQHLVEANMKLMHSNDPSFNARLEALNYRVINDIIVKNGGVNRVVGKLGIDNEKSS